MTRQTGVPSYLKELEKLCAVELLRLVIIQLEVVVLIGMEYNVFSRYGMIRQIGVVQKRAVLKPR